MCGIAGGVWRDRSASGIDRAMAAMGAAIAHRGPDAEGIWTAPGVGFVHRRLSIIDLEGGDQPIFNEDRSVVVVFNGEIYNYAELRDLLLLRGHHLSTHSDTEVLVHLYEDEGADLVARLRGMFAFAIWDASRERMVFGRDRVGLKPLYLARTPEAVYFASEPKAILALGVAREIDPAALVDVASYGFVSGTRSIFRGVERLAPGHVLELDRSELVGTARRYWRLDFTPGTAMAEADWRQRVVDAVDDSVRAHLVADVPVGAFLSGGIDSTLVVALASARSGADPLQTFSLGFAERTYSELDIAAETARHLGTRHRDDIVTPSAAELAGKLAFHFDEPFADPSAIPTYLVSAFAAAHAKVALSGDGGDEAFGGYSRYSGEMAEDAWRQRMPATAARVAGLLAGGVPDAAGTLVRRAKTLGRGLGQSREDAYADALAIAPRGFVRELLGRDDDAPGRGAIVAAMRPWKDHLSAMTAADVAVRLPDDYLVKVDRASMAHGLEVRPPLVDHRLLELAASVPSALKIADGEKKRILKSAFADRLPAHVLTQPKRGFDVPLDEWFRGPLREMFADTVLAPSARCASFLSQAVARRAFDEHLARRRDGGRILWMLLMLETWARVHLGAARR